MTAKANDGVKMTLALDLAIAAQREDAKRLVFDEAARRHVEVENVKTRLNIR